MEIEHILNAVAPTSDDEDNYTLHEHKSIRPGDKKVACAEVGLMDLFQDDDTRPMMITAIVLHLSQQFCGINAVFYYSTSFFEGVIDNPLLGSTLVAAINVLATMLATVLMDSHTRRKLMVVSSVRLPPRATPTPHLTMPAVCPPAPPLFAGRHVCVQCRHHHGAARCRSEDSRFVCRRGVCRVFRDRPRSHPVANRR